LSLDDAKILLGRMKAASEPVRPEAQAGDDGHKFWHNAYWKTDPAM
jgi:hypothetical protein